MSQKNKHQLLYTYTQEEATPIRYAHGVWGGVTSHDEIEMHFYVESTTPPTECAPDAQTGEQTQSVVERAIHSKVLMDYSAALALHQWLTDKLEDIEQRQGYCVHDDTLG